MAWVVLLCIIALPLIEIALFIEVAGAIGVLPAIAGAVLAGLAGVALWKYQGLQTLMRARQALDRGEMPMAEVFDGLCLLLAGFMLILPGFLSDAVALLLLLPPVRALLAALMARRAVVVGQAAPPHPYQPTRPPVIDADYREIDGDDTDGNTKR